MSVDSYEELRSHLGHRVRVVAYSTHGRVPDNVAVECETCHVVLLDYDRPADDPDRYEHLTCIFVAQMWVDDNAMQVDPLGPTRWHPSTSFALRMWADYEEASLSDPSLLDEWRQDEVAPAWVRDWPGPFEIYIEEDRDL